MAERVYFSCVLGFYPLVHKIHWWMIYRLCDEHLEERRCCRRCQRLLAKVSTSCLNQVLMPALIYFQDCKERAEAIDKGITFRKEWGPFPLVELRGHMRPADIEEIQVRCWRAGRLGDWLGVQYIDCECSNARCNTEMLCEVLAAHILMPGPWWLKYKNLSTEELADLFACEYWTVRFRRVLYAVTGK